MSKPVDAAGFIRAQTAVASPSLVPEIKLHLATEITPLWQATEATMRAGHLAPPFWAFAWPGGQGIARYLIDHPETIRGKRVLDFAAGSGMAAIAAMKTGAEKVTAIDIDPFAEAAMRLNAALNGVVFEIENTITMENPPKNIDLILAGDICYEQAMTTRILRWLWLCMATGIDVMMGDPGRAYVPESGLTELASYVVPTTREVEGEDSRTVKVWKVGLPNQE